MTAWSKQLITRAHDDERAVFVHGDVHEWNTLAAGDGFKPGWRPMASRYGPRYSPEID